MKLHLSLAFILLVIPAMAQTPGSPATPKRDWDTEWSSLNTYDSAFASRLKSSDGTWVKPKPEIVAVLKVLKDPIAQAAKDMGVDPRAIAGCILAENTMNVGVSDGVQDWLVKTGLASNGSLMGKKFTFGLGQLNFDVARVAEAYAARIEKRTPLTDQQLQDALLDPTQSVKQIAQVLRKIQDTYKVQGFDISKNPEILTSVYNLGGEEKRSKEAKANNRLPRPNYFGFFVDKYMGTIEGVVGKPAAPKPVVATTVVVASATVAKSTVKTPAVAKVAKTQPQPQKKLAKQSVLSDSIPLVQSPPTCEKESYGYDANKRYSTYKDYAVSGIAEKGSTWKLLVPSIDCEAQKWSLIRTDHNTVGWAKTEDLEKFTISEYREEKKCDEKNDTQCRAEVEKESKELVSKVENKTALTYLHPVSTKGGDHGNFKNRNDYCPAPQKPVASSALSLSSTVVAGGGSAVSANVNGGVGTGPSVNPNAAATVRASTGGTCPQGYTSINGMCVKNGYSVMMNASPTASATPVVFVKDGRCGADFYFINGTCVSVATVNHNKGKSVNYVGYSLQGSRLVSPQGRPKNSIESLEKAYKKLVSKVKSFGDQDDPSNVYAGLASARSTEIDSFNVLKSFKECIQIQKSQSRRCDIDLQALDSAVDSLKAKKNPSLDEVEETAQQFYSIKEMLDSGLTSSDEVQANWIATSEEILKIDQNEALRLMESCRSKFDEKKLTYSAEKISSEIGRLKKISADDWFANEAARHNAANIVKYCADTLDLFFGDSLHSKTEKSLCDVRASELQFYNFRTMNKALVKKYFGTPDQIDSRFTNSLEWFLQATDDAAVKARQIQAAQNAMSGGITWYNGRGSGSGEDYCPNRTADFIEELLANHPCIKKIYVPDVWLLSRLNQVKSKIVYRPFEKDNVYAIDYSEDSCK